MIDLTQFSRDYTQIIEDASAMAKKLHQETVSLLNDNLDKLQRIAEQLLIKETLEETEIDALIAA